MTDVATPPSAGGFAATMTGQLNLSELQTGTVLGGRFRIESMLGIGGMGVVYRAHDLSLDIDVAIKLLRPELARRPEAFDRFRQEILLARQVSSPHVVRIHDIAEQDGRWFISMDWIDGESLEHRLDSAQRLPVEEVLAITRGLLDGLSAAHARGVVHRDLKPANVLLDREGRAYITDFGIARSLGSTGMTQSGMIVGTPEYLSPEQARGESVDARSDLYALGLIVYEMLSGALPFSGGTPAETVMQRIVRAPPPLARTRPDLPHWLTAFCDRLLKLNPAHRFANAQEALRALDTRRVPKPPFNRRLGLLSALVVVAGLGIADWLYLHPLQFASNAPLLGAAVVATPRVAVLPLTVPTTSDADLAPLARALDEHLRAWMRDDAAIAVVPRPRVLAALARTIPDVHNVPNANARQLASIIQAANANLLLQGELHRDKQNLTLSLHLIDTDGNAKLRPLQLRGDNAAGLFEQYRGALGPWLQLAKLQVGDAPKLAPAALMNVGKALLSLDRSEPAQVDVLAADATGIGGSGALIASVLVQGQQGAGQDIAAQATRDAIAKEFAEDVSANGRELYARTLADNDQADLSIAALAKAQRAYPHDAALLMLDAETLADNGKGAQALDLLRRYVEVDDKDARAWFLLGRTAIGQGEAQLAVDEYLLRALVLNARTGDVAGEATVHNALGVGYERLGQLDSAAEQYEKAAAMRDKLGDETGLSISLKNLATVQAERGDHVAADRTLDRVKVLLEKSNDRASLADLYNSRGVVAEEHGDLVEALKYYRMALALRQELNLPDKVAESLNNVGFISYQNGDFDNALAFWRQASAQYQKLDDHNGLLHIEQSIGLLDIARGHLADARQRLQGTLQTATDHQLPEETAVAQNYLAELALVEGRYADATTAAARAAEIFARRADQRGQNESALLKARIALELGDGDGADQALARLAAQPLGDEQRAQWILVQARRLAMAGDGAAAGAKLDAAAKSADAAHSGAVGIRIQLERIRQAIARADMARASRLLVGLRRETVRLGEVPLRLEWLEHEIAVSLRSGDRTVAVKRYREAIPLLRTCGRFRDAGLIHRLGALALEPAAVDVKTARASAESARQETLSDAPAEARRALEEQLARRWREESGQVDSGS